MGARGKAGMKRFNHGGHGGGGGAGVRRWRRDVQMKEGEREEETFGREGGWVGRPCHYETVGRLCHYV